MRSSISGLACKCPAASASFAVCLVRFAGDTRILSGCTCTFFICSPMRGAAFSPRLLSGRSISDNAGSSQLDLACRNRYKIFLDIFMILPMVSFRVGRRFYLASLSLNFREAEFMQYLRPVGLGPSSNTWPRCASHRLQCTSMRFMKKAKSFSFSTFFS
jgi:hypothetical protein